MSIIRASFHLRQILTISVIVLAALTVYLVIDEFNLEWKQYQKEYHELYRQKVSEKIAEAEKNNQADELEKLQALLKTLTRI